MDHNSTAVEAVIAGRGAIRELLKRSSDLRLKDLNLGTGPTIALIIAAWFLLSAYTRPSIQIADAPISGRRSKWEPDFSLLWRYTAQAREIIGGGYDQVSVSESKFILNCVKKKIFPSSKIVRLLSSVTMSTGTLCLTSTWMSSGLYLH